MAESLSMLRLANAARQVSFRSRLNIMSASLSPSFGFSIGIKDTQFSQFVKDSLVWRRAGKVKVARSYGYLTAIEISRVDIRTLVQSDALSFRTTDHYEDRIQSGH
jgi:hypothetical protein